MEERVIVLAEKSEAARKKFSSLMKKEGCTVIAANDGIEALKRVFSESPSLLVVNNSLPKLPGHQVARFLKQDPNVKSLPVIILASRGDREKLEKMQFQEREIFTGSLDDKKLLEKIRKLLKNGAAPKKGKGIKKIPYSKSDQYLLERTVTYLDRKNEEEELIRELREIAFEASTFEETFEMALLAALRMVDLNAAVMYFHGDYRSKILIRVFKPVTPDFLDRLQGIVFDSLSHKGIYCDPADVDVKQVKGADEEPPVSQEKLRFFSDTIETEDRVRGFIGYSCSSPKGLKVIEERREFFQMFFQQMFLGLERSYMKEKLQRLSTLDALTQVNNRHRVIDVLKKELLRARRYFLDLSVILFDIDNFKTINDFYGYQVGDVILKDLARITQETMRSIDEVGRYGGEEFLVILPETNLKNAGIAGNRLKTRVLNHIFPGIAKDIKISLSIGITSYLRDVDIGVDDMLRRTDQSLYEAKKRGKNCVFVMTK